MICYELMVSTIPIIELNKLADLFADLKLQHSTVVLVGIALKKPQNQLAEQLSWAYYPRKSINFYRCTVISNFSNALTPDPDKYWSVLCEIGRKPDDELESKEELIKRVIQGKLKVVYKSFLIFLDLITVNIIDSEEQVYSTYHRVIQYGYPIPTLNRDENMQRYQNAFEGIDN